MRLCYVLLSPTWGMHQYTADLANRQVAAGRDVHLVTTSLAPVDRYAPAVTVHTPVSTRDSGFSFDGLRRLPGTVRHVRAKVCALRPDVVHFCGPHLANPLLLRALRREGIPAVHTLHDLHPHAGSAYGRLLYAWNIWVWREAGHIVVHGRRWEEELEGRRGDAEMGRRGDAETRGHGAEVTCTPLTHLFVSYEVERGLRQRLPDIRYEPWALFVGRMEKYKGLDFLIDAARRMEGNGRKIVIAGPSSPRWRMPGPVPSNVEVRDRLIGDEEAVELFSRCGLVVLPYVEASQSALIGAAYFFRKPVLVTRVGALPQYVVEWETGWVVPPGDAVALADALQAGLGKPERLQQMGDAGRAWYDAAREEEGRALEEMYTRVAGTRGAGTRSRGDDETGRGGR
ncbi:MAG TPA: glycosyltransferase family 4 protein [Anaerolineae bacterium]|nr:glycosyltransferase family 4 protein [Anaerolineae bacterium]